MQKKDQKVAMSEGVKGEKSIDGLSELEDAITDLGGKTGGLVLRRALKKVAAPIADKARQNVAVDSGAARDSIRLSAQSGKGRGKKNFSARVRVMAGGKATKRRKFAEHAAQVEFGTKKHPAQPFLRPAFDSEVEAAVETVLQS